MEYSNLSHLSPSEIDDVIKLYEEGGKVREIADLYNIVLIHGSLAPLLPVKVLTELCPYCGVNLLKTISRTNPETYCPECSHKPLKSCTCNNCIRAREESRKRVRDAVLDSQSVSLIKPKSLAQWLYLKAIFSAGHLEDGVIKPIDEVGVKLTPDNQILNDIMIAKSLYSSGVIHISEKSSIYAFPREDECKTPSFYIGKVCFKMDLNNLQLSAFEEQEIDELRKQIAVAEVLEYIEYQIEKVGHTFSYSDEIKRTVYTLLEGFSPAQILSIVWSSVNYATRCYSEGWLKKKDFTSHLLKSCIRYADRSMSEGWKVKSFERCKQLPQSLVSQLLDGVLGHSGFNHCKESYG